MKKIYSLIIITLIISTSLNAQSRRKRGCTNPLSNYAFQQKFKGIQRQLNEAYKLKSAINIVHTNCLTSAQVKEITLLFQTDQSRISFAKEAYLKTSDRNQFHHVYDAFNRFRNVAQVHAHILTLRKGGSGGNSGGTGGTGNSLAYPNWNYPSLSGYRGKTNCSSFMNNTSFTGNAIQIQQQSGESNRYSRAWQVATTNCMTTAQVMKLVSFLRQDNNRLAILKGAFDHTYDIDNYASARVTLSNYSTQQDFDRFLKDKVEVKEDVVVSCLISDSDFKSVNSRIKKEWVGRKKFSMIQTIFKSKGKCYAIAQLKNIGKQFSFPSEKLQFAKYAYDYSHKKDDYYQMADIFRSSFSKQDFMDFLKKKQK